MASYLSSYFGTGQASNTNDQYQSQYNQPQHSQYGQSQQQHNQPRPQAQSTSTWTGTFSTRIAGLRKALTRDSEEDDPDNEDASHVSNVLRAYYTEKSRTFPEWLPPDPYKPVVATPAQQYGMNTNQYGNTHNRTSSGAGLSDLWDSGPTRPAQQAQSLRTPRPQAQPQRSFDSRDSQAQQPSGARPLLPSQRSGSHQSLAPQPLAQQPVVGSRDRLRARLQAGGGGRSTPPISSNQSQSSYFPQNGSQQGSSGEYDPYKQRPSGY
ncbi:hypothetical protein LTR66_017487, partial [Elasticomyces elasticus]